MSGAGSSPSSRRNSLNSLSRDLELPSEEGCLSIVVLGASGDLAKKKTFPALYHLFYQVKNALQNFNAYPVEAFSLLF
jgi:glucose-6-phosphate 1-dehydrogenase